MNSGHHGQLTLSILGTPVTVSINCCLHPLHPGPCKRARSLTSTAPRKVAPKKAAAKAPNATDWLKRLTPDNVQEAVSRRHPDVELDVHPTSNGDLHLDLIRVSEGRGQGKAQAAMKDLTAAADHLRRRMTLTPEPLAGDTKTKKARLVAWYKSHGFIENKGRAKDYTTGAAMYRDPQPPAGR